MLIFRKKSLAFICRKINYIRTTYTMTQLQMQILDWVKGFSDKSTGLWVFSAIIKLIRSSIKILSWEFTLLDAEWLKKIVFFIWGSQERLKGKDSYNSNIFSDCAAVERKSNWHLLTLTCRQNGYFHHISFAHYLNYKWK